MTPEARRLLCRQLRREQTPPERLFWELVRDRRWAGLKFRRQHPLGRFVLDFYCPALQLAVELDGDVHGDQRERDQERDLLILDRGIRVVRVRNGDLLRDPEGVLAAIRAAVESPGPA